MRMTLGAIRLQSSQRQLCVHQLDVWMGKLLQNGRISGSKVQKKSLLRIRYTTLSKLFETFRYSYLRAVMTN